MRRGIALFLPLTAVLGCSPQGKPAIALAPDSTHVSQFAHWLETPQAAQLVGPRVGGGYPIYLPPQLYGAVMRVPGSVKPVCQLTGDHEQWQPAGSPGAPVNEIPVATQGLIHGQMGADLGIPITVGSRTFFYFGDTWFDTLEAGKYSASLYFGSAFDELDSSNPRAGQPAWAAPPIGAWGALDSWGYVDNITQACPTLQWTTNSGGPDAGYRSATIVWENGAPMSTRSFETPVGGFGLNGAVYLFYTTGAINYACNGDGGNTIFITRSVLAKSTASDGSDPNVLYTVSQAPSASQLGFTGPTGDICAQRPNEAALPGKFINVGAVVWDGSHPVLPAGSMPFSGPAVFFFGTTWMYRNSTYGDAFLAVAPQSGIEEKSSWYYFAGMSGPLPVWSKSELAAVPIFSDLQTKPAELSASYNSYLNSWIVFYGGLQIQSASYPWGPWGQQPMVGFDAWKDRGYCHFMHGFTGTSTTCTPPPPNTPPTVIVDPATGDVTYQQCLNIGGSYHLWNSCDTIENNDPRLATPLPPDSWGGAYGPYIVDTLTRAGSAPNTTDVYFTMSTWVPYQSWLFTATLTAVPQDALEPDDTWSQAASIQLGKSYPLSISSPWDTDYLSVQLPGSAPTLAPYPHLHELVSDVCGTLDVTVTDATVPTQLQIVDAAGSATNPCGGAYGSGTTSLSLAAGGNWGIQVTGNGKKVGNYTIEATFTRSTQGCQAVYTPACNFHPPVPVPTRTPGGGYQQY